MCNLIHLILVYKAEVYIVLSFAFEQYVSSRLDNRTW